MDIQWLATEIRRRGLTQAAVGAAAGLNPSQMSKVMGGTRQLKAREADLIRLYLGYPATGAPSQTLDDAGPEAWRQRLHDMVADLTPDEGPLAARLLGAAMGPRPKPDRPDEEAS